MKPTRKICAALTVVGVIVLVCLAYAQQEQRGQTSYMPVDIKETFASIMARMTKAKPAIEKETPTGSTRATIWATDLSKASRCRAENRCREEFV